VAFSYDIEPDGLVMLTGIGSADRSTWLSSLFAIRSDPGFRDDAPLMFDLTAMTCTPPPMYVGAFTEDVRGLLPGNRIAVVTTLDALSVIARQVAMLVGARMVVVDSSDHARCWLRGPAL